MLLFVLHAYLYMMYYISVNSLVNLLVKPCFIISMCTTRYEKVTNSNAPVFHSLSTPNDNAIQRQTTLHRSTSHSTCVDLSTINEYLIYACFTILGSISKINKLSIKHDLKLLIVILDDRNLNSKGTYKY